MSPEFATMDHELALFRSGSQTVGGMDEAGMGSLAGPVVAAIVVVSPEVSMPPVRDSKTLSASQRAALASIIKESVCSWNVARSTPKEVDRHNVRRAGLLAMHRALSGLPTPPDTLLIDAFDLPKAACTTCAVPGGDRVSATIAAASILAKVYRDELMKAYDEQFPGYGFSSHKGYGTALHLEALLKLGPTPIHRMTYAPVAAAART